MAVSLKQSCMLPSWYSGTLIMRPSAVAQWLEPKDPSSVWPRWLFFFMEVKSSVAPVLTVSLRIKDPLLVFRIHPEPSTTELLVAHVWLGHLKPSKFEIQ